MEGKVFQKMLEPFDPSQSEGEEGVTRTENPEDNRGEDQEADEATQPKTRAAPTQPSREEVEKQMVTHLPFRDWCPHCVRGKPGSKPHKSNQSVHEIPTVAVDYMFMHTNQNEQEESGMPILVTKDLLNCGTGTGMLSASVLVQKGVCAQATRRLSAEVGKLGHSELILKSDGEPAIVALKSNKRGPK